MSNKQRCVLMVTTVSDKAHNIAKLRRDPADAGSLFLSCEEVLVRANGDMVGAWKGHSRHTRHTQKVS